MADREDFATEVGQLIKGRSPVGHNHDGRYYTETEMDSKLDGIATAYDLARQDGFVGTLSEWLDSLVGPRGPEGPYGGTEVTDPQVASFIGPGLTTATASALDESYRRGFSVAEYGAVGDGITDDTAAIQAACAAAEAASTGTITAQVFIPAGIYRITDTINFITNVDAAQATFWYYGTGTAIQVGHTSPGALADRDMHLPKVICRSAPAGTWDGTSVGVKILSTNQCRIHIPRVETFEIGVLITANGAAGTAYCEFYLGSLWINHENLVMDQGYGPSVGWINQNNFYGGRITHSVNRGIPDDPVACHLRIGNRNNFPADNVPDGNAFYGLSMEGVNAGEGGWARYRIFMFGKYNQFFNCRFEARDGGVPVLRSEGLASNNIIHGGYHSWRLVQSGLNAFDIRDGTPGRLDAVNTTGQVLVSGENTTVTGWTTSTLSKVAHNAGTGEFTPTPGRWRIRARITYAQNTTGTRTTRLYRGGTVIDQAVLGAQSTNAALTTVVESTAAFNGAETFKVTAQQTSGAPLALTGSAPYVSIQADYLGH